MNPFRRSRVLGPLDPRTVENVRRRDKDRDSKKEQWKQESSRPAFAFAKPRHVEFEALRGTTSPLVLIYDPDTRVHPGAEITHIQDEERVLQRMLDEFDSLGRAIVGWPTQIVEGICPGLFCVLVQDGDHPHGCYAQGEIIGGPLIDVDGRPIVVAMFHKMTDPRRGKFL